MFPPDLGKGSEQQTDKYNHQGGNTIENPNMKSDNDRKMNTMQDTTVNKKTTMMHPDGFMMVDGKMMVVKNEKMTIMEKDVTLANGTLVMTNGNYMKKGGAKMMIKKGEHLDTTGKIIPMK